METNINLIAVRAGWPPGSWDQITMARFVRIVQAMQEADRLNRAAIRDMNRNG